MPTRSVNLTDHYDHFVNNLVASGRYKNVSEVIRAGLRLLEREAKENEERLAALRKMAAEGFNALDQDEAAMLDGEHQLKNFIRRIGCRAAKPAAHDSSGY